MRTIALTLVVCAAAAFSGCGYSSSSMSGNTSLAPVVNGAWMITFTPSAQGTAATTLSVNFSQNGSSLSGAVTAVNNPASSCFPVISSQATFTVSGQAVAQNQSNSNLMVNVAFMSGSSSGTINSTGSLAYLGTMATGTFNFAGGTSGCTSGTFTMTQG